MLFTRPGELRRMEWAEVDIGAALWVIPAEKMKMRESHIVPLCKQALAILENIKPLTGDGVYVFPSDRGKGRPLSDGTLSAALRRMGYSTEEMTAHGFRATARTLLDEALGYEPHLIDRLYGNYLE